MKADSGNIYRNARKTAGFTQERWAEYLGISTEAVRQYEGAVIMPSDEVVLKMAEVSGMPILAYWHLVRKSRLAAQILPDLNEQKGLPEAVLGLMVAMDAFREGGMRDLVRIAADGKINSEEAEDFDRALDQLRELMRRVYEMTYAGQ